MCFSARRHKTFNMLICIGVSPRNVYGNQGFPAVWQQNGKKKLFFQDSLIGIVFLGKVSGGKERKFQFKSYRFDFHKRASLTD